MACASAAIGEERSALQQISHSALRTNASRIGGVRVVESFRWGFDLWFEPLIRTPRPFAATFFSAANCTRYTQFGNSYVF